MREIHFSRNPKMAQLLHEYEYVREFGEGVDRMYREMEEAGLPEPEYKTVAFMVHATIKNKKYLVGSESTTPQVNPKDKTQATPQDKILEFCKIPRSKNEIVAYMGYKDPRYFTKEYMKPLLKNGELVMTIPDKPNSKNQKYVTKK